MLNVDSAVAGPDLDIDGVPSLRDLLLDAAGAVTDIRSGRTLRQSWIDRRRAALGQPTPRVDLPDPATPRRRARTPRGPRRGSRPSWTRWARARTTRRSSTTWAIPALDVGFNGRYGVYHSIYDDFSWMEKFGDPEFLTHATAARLYTVIAMRAAAAEVVPLTFVPYGEALREASTTSAGWSSARPAPIDPGRDKPPLEFEGLADLLRSLSRVRGPGRLPRPRDRRPCPPRRRPPRG